MNNQQMFQILSKAGVTESNCSNYYLILFDGEFVVNQDGMGVCLECLDGGSLENAWDYLQDCF